MEQILHIQKLFQKIDHAPGGSHDVLPVAVGGAAAVEAVAVAAGDVKIALMLPDAELKVLEGKRTDAFGFECSCVAQKDGSHSGAAAGLPDHREIGADGLFECQTHEFGSLLEHSCGPGVFGTVGVDDLIPGGGGQHQIFGLF